MMCVPLKEIGLVSTMKALLSVKTNIILPWQDFMEKLTKNKPILTKIHFSEEYTDYVSAPSEIMIRSIFQIQTLSHLIMIIMTSYYNSF